MESEKTQRLEEVVKRSQQRSDTLMDKLKAIQRAYVEKLRREGSLVDQFEPDYQEDEDEEKGE